MRSAAAEAVGTALLPAAVVGSGIMGERLALIALTIAFAPRSRYAEIFLPPA